MLTVETVLDSLGFVDLVEDPVSVLKIIRYYLHPALLL
jgi:hypothetical protein